MNHGKYRKRVDLRLEAGLVECIDRAAIISDVTRTEMIRRACRNFWPIARSHELRPPFTDPAFTRKPAIAD